MGEDRGSQERLEFEHVPVPVGTTGVSITGFSMDNVHHAERPSGLVAGPGEDGVKTEWDASTLESAIKWLEAHAGYLDRLSYSMVDIQELMGGAAAGGAAGMPSAPGATSPLGSFEWAGRLAGKHSSLYNSTEAAVRRFSANLYDAAEALRRVKDNYETAEKANAMSAADMAQIFADVARNDQR